MRPRRFLNPFPVLLLTFLVGCVGGVAQDAAQYTGQYRSVADPKRFVPRYWDARHLAPLLLKYRDRLPAIGT